MMTGANTIKRGFTLRRVLNAPREVVFQAWTDPAHLQWFFNPSMPNPHEPITVDLRVGGAWRVKFVMSEEVEYYTGGIYREIVPGEKLVFTWGATDGWPKIDLNDPDDCPVITILFSDLGERTEMIFHVRLAEGMADERVREWLATGMREGWGATIDRVIALFAEPLRND
jgi:uncharacterized protein YndB with AHSA1/START domain